MDRSRLGIEPIVLLDGVQAPMRVLIVEQSAGGGRLDYAHLELDTGNAFLFNGDPLHDLVLGSQIDNRTCEIVLPLPDGKRKLIHYGKIKALVPQLHRHNAGLGYISRLEPYHFGSPLYGMQILAKFTEGDERPYTLPRTLVFNPVFEDQTIGNRDQRLSPQGYHYFLDPGQSQSYNAKTWNGQTADVAERNRIFDDSDLASISLRPSGEQWTLGHAVTYLCKVLNPDEAFVLNPAEDAAALDLILQPNFFGADSEPPVLRDVQIGLGTYLATALDRLLTPFGFAAKLQYTQPGQKPRIAFFELGRGSPLEVGYQRAGEVVNPDNTSMEGFDLRYDVGQRLFNRSLVYGDYPEVELTVELVRAWDSDLDSTDPEDLKKSAAAYALDPALQRVHRDWVLHSDGSYVGVKQAGLLVGVPLTAPTDLNTLLSAITISPQQQDAAAIAGAAFPAAAALQAETAKLFAPTRKRFGPCLALNADGSPAGELNGFRAEYSVDSGETWIVITPETFGTVQLLTREAGLRFDSEDVPELLVHAGHKARVRITATLRCDARISGIAVAASSPNPEPVTHVLDLPQRFFFRTIHSSSTFYSEVRNGTRPSAEWDDRYRIQRFAQELVNAWNQADCDGPIHLDGLDRPAELGQVVAAIQGRNIDLSLNDRARYPQVVGISWDIRHQTTTLTLTSFRDEVRL